ncbi:MAG: linear amide C-N hydrolase [Clostridia bacterium]|nr:linear amide C-N hydrolase [Clostridia bacterium]
MKLWKKILIGVLVTILALVLITATVVFAIWGNEISTVMSIKEIRARNDEHLDGSVYRMDVKGGFYFDEFLNEGGAESDGELIEFVTGRITKGLIDMGIENPEIGCSSVTLTTEDGDRLFGRNYDFDKTNTCIVFTKGNGDRHSTISTVDLQFLGIDKEKGIDGLMDKITCLAAPYAPLDGINSEGVSCGIYMTYQGGEKTVATNQMTEKPDITSTTMLRLILDYADDVDEAVELVKKYDLHDSANTSYHYMVADSTGRSVILEWVPTGTDATDNDGSRRELVVHYNDNDAYLGDSEANASYQWITNFVLNPGYYDGCDVSEKKGYDRYIKLEEVLRETNATVKDEKAGMQVLATVGRRNWNNDDSNSVTVHSAIYNLTDKTVYWVSNENWDDESAIFEFSLAE